MENKPAAIVLCQVITGLSTAHSLAIKGVEVHAVSFKRHEPVHFSRRFKQIKLTGKVDDEDYIIDWLIRYAKKIGNSPVVIPTSDAHALMLAKNYHQLAPYCRLSTTSYEDLRNIISKEGLYSLADKAGVDVIPAIHEPTLKQLEEWTVTHAGPYFIKPFYENMPGCALTEKNIVLADTKSLHNYIETHGSKSLIIQRMINGGDGYIFDCYGMCDVNGQPLTMASHRRWRQSPMNVGTTSYGEIPANPEGKSETVLFDYTTRLLAGVKHHGIFGIEWLQDRETGKLYLIDFNARPFSSVGHLTSCGLNLPFFAYAELIGDDLSSLQSRPVLEHSFWVDLLKDLLSLRDRLDKKQITLSEWFKSLLRCKHFACWDWTDPGPEIYRLWQITLMGIQFVWKRIKFN